ncbi:nucleotide sugar dehydrogenase [Actinoallomurus iriomotensis]|uniref:Nucleotide sugar dehydrogenase n=1 Tax=Actinoallomurus iriomotensis TaxID=478107 RepID=A0A9W6RIT9_9ACTN|nr:nucleotide sugar dehydrogenase [Actinoallomurus iriomotensis]GLY74680.1 nucleotide sugar dehydrogenase [Actinoallomurus iriomotensis]
MTAAGPETTWPAPACGTYDVAIIGLGYVGLPTALAFHAAGGRVLAVDVSAERLAKVRDGAVDLLESDRARLEAALNDDGFALVTDPSYASWARAVIICVPTPVTAQLVPDLRALAVACDAAVRQAVPGQVIILTSTSYVGCTEDLLAAPLAARGLRAGQDVFVAFSPERIDPGNDRYTHEVVPRVVGGTTPQCTAAAAKVLAHCTRNVHEVSSTGAAELTKLFENTFRAVNIALANEMAEVGRTLGLDIMEVIKAAATKPYGFMPFFPGPGAGGHCIPCDPHYLLWQLREKRLQTPVVTEAMAAIAGRPHRVVERVREVLSDAGLGLAGARVLVLGVTYKPDVEDVRESPALEIMTSLLAGGATVAYHDPHVPEVRVGDRVLHSEDPAAAATDLVIVHTRHRAMDLGWLGEDRLVLDTTYRLSGPIRRAVL